MLGVGHQLFEKPSLGYAFFASIIGGLFPATHEGVLVWGTVLRKNQAAAFAGSSRTISRHCSSTQSILPHPCGWVVGSQRGFLLSAAILSFSLHWRPCS